MLCYYDFDEGKSLIKAQCEKCNSLVEITHCVDVNKAKECSHRHLLLDMPVKCRCGTFYTCLEFHDFHLNSAGMPPGTSPIVFNSNKPNPAPSKPAIPQEEAVKCPRCASQQIYVRDKGFGLGKAVAGGLLLGGVGLLGGFIGSKKIRISCLKCNHSWIS